MRYLHLVGFLVLVSCHTLPVDSKPEYVNTAVDAGADEGCVGGYVLRSRYLGEAFALQVSTTSLQDIDVVLAPVASYARNAALWIMERSGSEEPDAVRIRNLSLPGMFLSNSAFMLPDDQEGDGIWFVETVTPEFEADVPLFLLRPKNTPNSALGTTLAPPYSAEIAAGTGSANQHWRLTPYQLCDGL